MLRVDHKRWGQRPEDLRNLAVKAPHARSRERFLALYEITQGSNATRVAARIGRRPHNVMEWVHRYNAGGPDAVSYRRTGGRVAVPSAAARDLLSKPSTAGLSDREIARRAGLSPTTVGKLRRDLGTVARDRSVTRHLAVECSRTCRSLRAKRAPPTQSMAMSYERLQVSKVAG